MVKLFVTIVVTLVIGGAIGAYVMENPSIISRNEYAWQKSCDSRCAEMVGKRDMAQIDAAGCADLNMIIGFGLVADKEHQAAMDDKFSSINCTPPPPPDPAKSAADFMKQYQPDEAALQRMRESMGLTGGIYDSKQ